MSYESRINDVLVAAGCSPEALSANAVWDWQQRWREVYAIELQAATGRWRLHDYDWHVFSHDYHRHVHGFRACDEYRAIGPCSFVVISAWARETFGFTCEGTPPETLERRIDILVAPVTLEWTMAFSHGDHHGPYFARP